MTTKFRPMIEALEGKCLLATGVGATFNATSGHLWVEGSDQKDAVLVIQANDRITVRGFDWTSSKYVNVTELPSAAVRWIVVNAKGGDDVVNLSSGAAGQQPLAALCTVFGGSGVDLLLGSASHDMIFAGSGNDRVFSYGGKDRIWGGDGDDYLFGGDGNDFLGGGAGVDRLYGDGHDDILDGGLDVDHLDGGAGKDNYFEPWGGAYVTFDPSQDSYSAHYLGTEYEDVLMIQFLTAVRPPAALSGSANFAPSGIAGTYLGTDGKVYFADGRELTDSNGWTAVLSGALFDGGVQDVGAALRMADYYGSLFAGGHGLNPFLSDG